MPSSVDLVIAQIESLRREFLDFATTPQLIASSIDNGSLELKTGGVLAGVVGTQYDGTTGAVTLAGPRPPTPSAPTLTTATGGVLVGWGGTWDPATVTDAAGNSSPVVAPQDFSGIEIHVSTNAAMTADSFGTLVGPLMTSARGFTGQLIPWPATGAPLYARLVARSAAGRASLPSARTGPVPSGQTLDAVAPSAPTNVQLTSSVTQQPDGTDVGLLSATWTAPTTDVNGDALNDLSHYLVEFKPTAGSVWTPFLSGATSAVFTVPTGVPHQLRVAAVDKGNNRSAWSALATLTSAIDTGAPSTPTAPTVTNYLGLLLAAWDGKLGGSADPPDDFLHVEVHVSTTSGFTPAAATLVGTLAAAGAWPVDVPYGTTAYVRLVAVDRTGNRSGASGQGQGTTSKVVTDDLLAGAVGAAQLKDLAVTNAKLVDGAVGSSKLANLAVGTAHIVDAAISSAKIANLAVATAHINDAAIVTAKIADLAVNDAKIGSLSAAKITAGLMNAVVTISGRFQTAQNNPKVELNANGLQGFRADGNKWLSLTTAEALITAEIRTAATGRRIEMGAAGTLGEIEFWAPNGKRTFVRSYTEPSPPLESIQIGNDMGGHYLWNRVNINDQEQIAVHAANVEMHNLKSGSFRVWNYDTKASFTAGNIARFVLESGGFHIARPGGQIIIDAIENVPDGRIRIMPLGRGVANAGGIDFLGNVQNAPQSGRLDFVQGDGGGQIIKTFNSVVEFRTRNDGGFNHIKPQDVDAQGVVKAGGVVLTSDAKDKTDIADAALDGVAVTKGLRLRSYKQRRPRPGDDHSYDEVEQVGLVAQEAPPMLVTEAHGSLGISVYPYLAVLTATVQQLIARVEAAEQRLPPPPKEKP